MVGGGSRRDEGSLVISNTNVFAALDTLKKKKKSDKDKKNKGSSKSTKSESESQAFWAPAPLNATSWADVDDDDDDYYLTTAPPQFSDPQTTQDKPEHFEVCSFFNLFNYYNCRCCCLLISRCFIVIDLLLTLCAYVRIIIFLFVWIQLLYAKMMFFFLLYSFNL